MQDQESVLGCIKDIIRENSIFSSGHMLEAIDSGQFEVAPSEEGVTVFMSLDNGFEARVEVKDGVMIFIISDPSILPEGMEEEVVGVFKCEKKEVE